MTTHRSRRSLPGGGRRKGAATVELALVCPIALLMILGMIVLGLGVFRYQQVEALAREGARWAAVRGPSFQQDQELPAPTSADLLEQVILPRLNGLDPDELNCSLDMSGGTARVEVTYRWVPEFLLDPITITRRAEIPVTY